MEKKPLAVLTYFSEVICVFLTGIYSLIAFYDIRAGAATITSPSWFADGFCVWTSGVAPIIDSHSLSAIADWALGIPMTCVNYERYQSLQEDDNRAPGMFTSTAISFFCCLHGLGHLFFCLVPKDMLILLASPVESYMGIMFIGKYVSLTMFLAIGPAIGRIFGVRAVNCVIFHLIQSFIGAHVPLQFAFGIVQLVINSWYCVPRIFFIGTSRLDDVKNRAQPCYVVGSIGITMLMTIVFAEMLCCDLFWRDITGHFVYDFAILIMTAVFSHYAWQKPKTKDC